MLIKLRMEMGNMSKRQQPDQGADNNWSKRELKI